MDIKLNVELKLHKTFSYLSSSHVYSPATITTQREPRQSWLTSVLCAQPQHEADGEDLGPGSFPLLYQDAKEVGRVGQQQVLQGLEGGANVEEAAVLLTAQEALREEWVTQVAQDVAFGRRGRREGEEGRGEERLLVMWKRRGGGQIGDIGEGRHGKVVGRKEE